MQKKKQYQVSSLVGEQGQGSATRSSESPDPASMFSAPDKPRAVRMYFL